MLSTLRGTRGSRVDGLWVCGMVREAESEKKIFSESMLITKDADFIISENKIE